MKTSNYIAQGVEINNSCEPEEWEDAQQLAAEIVEQSPQAEYLLIIAGNLDWRGASGLKLVEVNQETLWSDIAGTNGEWTLRSCGKIKAGEAMHFMCSSHDVPTGGQRIARLLDGCGLYKELARLGCEKKAIIQAVNGYAWQLEDVKHPTPAQIVEGLESMSAEDIADALL